VSIDAPEHAPSRPRRGRRPGPPAAFGWRWIYPVALGGLAVVALVLSATGARLVLDSRDGQVGRSEQDPTKPGYLATVAATPMLLVVHADGDDLYGAVLVALGADDTGGWAVFLSPDTVVSERGSLAMIYETDGIDNATTGNGLRSSVSTLFQADIDTTVTVDATSLAPLVEPVAPLTYELAEPVRATSNGRTTTLLEAGEVSIGTADEISAAIEVLGAGEEPIDRLDRQSAFWKAWIDAIRRNPDSAFPSGRSGTDLGRFMRGLAAGLPVVAHLPTVVFDRALVADAETLGRSLADIVPYPRQQGVRLNTAVLNGAGDLTLNEPMEHLLVANGAQIASRGNPDSFDVSRSSVVYHDPAIEPRARALAEAIGATDVRFEQKADSEIQVTVTIGSDFDPSKATTTTPTTTITTTATSTGAPR
jgi:hypothetical protein